MPTALLSVNGCVAPGVPRVPPASSPGVPFGDDPGAETVPKLAAGRAALRGQAHDPNAPDPAERESSRTVESPGRETLGLGSVALRHSWFHIWFPGKLE